MSKYQGLRVPTPDQACRFFDPTYFMSADEAVATLGRVEHFLTPSEGASTTLAVSPEELEAALARITDRNTMANVAVVVKELDIERSDVTVAMVRASIAVVKSVSAGRYGHADTDYGYISQMVVLALDCQHNMTMRFVLAARARLEAVT